MRNSRDRANEFVSNPGDPIHIIYSPKVSKDGAIDLVPIGKENTDDIIESYAESTDIRYILARVGEGQLDLLDQRKGTFGDFTEMPKTFAEALQLQIDSNRLFEALPRDVKVKFENDAAQFFAQAGSSEWADKLGPVLPEEYRKQFGVIVVPDPVKEEGVSE